GESLGAQVTSFFQAREERVDAFHVPAMTVDVPLSDHKIFLDRQRWKDTPALGHAPHPAAHGLERSSPAEIHPLDADLSVARRIETDNRTYERRLAHAVAAQQPEDLPLLQSQ